MVPTRDPGPDGAARIAVQAVSPADAEAALRLARELGVGHLTVPQHGGATPDGDPMSESAVPVDLKRRERLWVAELAGVELLLLVTPERLELQATARPVSGPIWADLTGDDAGGPRRPSSARDPDPLVRATGLHRLSAAERRTLVLVDATAGLGRDTHQLGSLGTRLVALERSPVVGSLLRDAWRRLEQRAASGEPACRDLLDRLTVHAPCDARAWLDGVRDTADAPDLVLVDPMHPPRRKSAEVRKELRLVREVVGADPDAADLLDAALGAARRRVVVKRPTGVAPLGDRRPSRAVEGRRVRYDVYLTP